MTTTNVPKKLESLLNDAVPKSDFWKKASNNGRAIEFCRVTLHDPKYVLLSIDYDDLEPKRTRPREFYKTVYRNESNRDDKQTLKQTQKTTNSFTWGFKEGITLGATATFSADVLIAQAETEFCTALSFEAHQEKTQEQEREWGIDTEIVIPPYMQTEATWLLYEGKVSTPYRARLQVIGGELVVHGIRAPKDLNLPEVPVAGVPSDLWLPLLTEEQRTFQTQGEFSARIGLYSRVDKRSTPLPRALTPAREDARVEMFEEPATG